MSRKPNSSSSAFKLGAVSLAFLMIAYQTALFVNKAARLRIEAERDAPDTVYIVRREYIAQTDESAAGGVSDVSAVAETLHRKASHSRIVESVREQSRRVESFRFNPNTASLDDFRRLGFSQKQAQSIVNYREKGGRYRRKSDFAKSYVVADSVYKRLESYIDIPMLDINKADSAAFDSLPGIGPYFAAQMVKYRDELGGYSCVEQLLEIYRFDEEKLSALDGLIFCSPPEPFQLWNLPVENLRKHPHIRSYQTARSIVLYRENTAREEISVAGLGKAGILDAEALARLSRCLIAPPSSADDG